MKDLIAENGCRMLMQSPSASLRPKNTSSCTKMVRKPDDEIFSFKNSKVHSLTYLRSKQRHGSADQATGTLLKLQGAVDMTLHDLLGRTGRAV